MGGGMGGDCLRVCSGTKWVVLEVNAGLLFSHYAVCLSLLGPSWPL